MDASEAGEGNLEILVQSAAEGGGGASVPTQVRPLDAAGEAVFAVDFTPRERADHIVRVTFNDEDVPGTSNSAAG